MKWFKFYGQDWLTDMKIMGMSMEDRLCYITLLSLASSSDNNGIVKACSEDALIRLSNIPNDNFHDINPAENARGCLKRYEALRCVTLHDNGDVTINNFERRQSEFLSNAERQKNYRERQKMANNIVKKKVEKRNDSNAIRYNDSNARIEKNREDKNIYIDKVIKKRKRTVNAPQDIGNSSELLSVKSSKEIKEPELFVWGDYIKKLEDNERRDLQVIGFYLKEKKVTCDTVEEARATVGRYLKVASQVKSFSDDKIVEATEKVKKEYPKMWTLDTIFKQLTK